MKKLDEKTSKIYKFRYLISEVQKSRDPAKALELADMFVNGELSEPKVIDGGLKFMKASRFTTKCSRCGEKYFAGSPCFFQRGKGWHVNCATEEEQQNEIFQSWLSKNK